MELSSSNNNTRIFVYDVIRLIAIISVVMLHCGAGMFLKFHFPDLSFTAGNFFDSISRFGVPLFVMLSGVFMLNEDKPLSTEKLVRKIKHLFFILILWSIFYALVYHFKKFFYFFFFGHYHLWYLFIIIGLYLITPILRLFVNIKNKAYLYYLLILALIFQFIPPVIDLICNHTDLVNRYIRMFRVNIVYGYTAYYILGYLFNKDWESINKYKNIIYILGFFSVIGIFLGVEFYTSHYNLTVDILYENSNMPVFLYSIAIFVLVKNLSNKYENRISDNIKTFISKLAQLSFGVYLIHPSFLKLTRSILRHNSLYSNMVLNNSNPFLYIILEFVMTILMSFFTVYLLSKIKYLNKLVKI